MCWHGHRLELSGARLNALHTIIMDPLYKALNKLAEKKKNMAEGMSIFVLFQRMLG